MARKSPLNNDSTRTRQKTIGNHGSQSKPRYTKKQYKKKNSSVPKDDNLDSKHYIQYYPQWLRLTLGVLFINHLLGIQVPGILVLGILVSIIIL